MHNPAQIRTDLQAFTGEDLDWNQIYRAMKAVATLSGGEPEQDEYGRDHVHGGGFEYHEKPSPDPTDDTARKVLSLAHREVFKEL